MCIAKGNSLQACFPSCIVQQQVIEHSGSRAGLIAQHLTASDSPAVHPSAIMEGQLVDIHSAPSLKRRSCSINNVHKVCFAKPAKVAITPDWILKLTSGVNSTPSLLNHIPSSSHARTPYASGRHQIVTTHAEEKSGTICQQHSDFNTTANPGYNMTDALGEPVSRTICFSLLHRHEQEGFLTQKLYIKPPIG